jgi:hypothetical protein
MAWLRTVPLPLCFFVVFCAKSGLRLAFAGALAYE